MGLLTECLKDSLNVLIQCPFSILRSRVLGREASESEPFPLGNVKEILHSPY